VGWRVRRGGEMSNVELPPEALDEIRQTEPLACLLCHDEREEPNYDLRIIEGSASTGQIGVAIHCSIGHVYLNAFIPLEGRVYLGAIVVDSPDGPETQY
jgi:hypothetical protein